jgi:DNA polymerase-3 subunit gamma/tau
VSGPSTPSAPSNTAPKLGNIGFSWSNLRSKSSKMNIIPGSIDGKDQQAAESHTFTQEDLELQWLAMCNRMPQQYSGIAARMKNMNPIITEMPQIEVTVDNELIKQEMQNIYKSILKTLKIYLHNDEIALTILVSDKPASQKVLTRREQFEEMSQKNPAVEALRQAFDLELA